MALEERGGGFFLLNQLPMVVDSSRLPRAVWEPRDGDLDELVALVERLNALRPYLPYGLPRRFIEHAGESEVGEFRPVTVLFANFYPFSQVLTLLGEDTDSAAQVLNAYYQRAQAVIHRYGGIVNKVDMYTHGDKLMALFGAPIAHEDDPERAVRAALELQTSLEHANQAIGEILRRAAGPLVAIDPHFLHQKIGINTGVVFAGQVGSASRHEYTVMGQPVNLSARLMAAAATGTTVLSPSTRRAVEGHIAVQELAPVQLKGIPAPVPIVQALYPRITDQSSSGAQAARRADLVGRATELDQLMVLARTALHGQGRICAIVGEIGIGKSRLVAELIGQLLTPTAGVPGFFPCLAECQSYDQSSPYAALRQVLPAMFGLSGDDAQAVRRLERLVGELVPDLARFTPLLGDILGIDLPETALTSTLNPEQRHDRAQELIEELVIASARSQPIVMVIDDLHWSDASSLELLLRIARRADRTALLMLLCYRSDGGFAEPWASLPHSTHLVISELSSASSAALIQSLLGGEAPEGLELLLEKTQGNPFFIEAVVQSLVESGALIPDAGSWRTTRPLSEVAIPDSIEGVITARLDRLDEPLRETAQIASVIGRRFGYSILDGIAVQPNLPERLDRLRASDIVTSDSDQREQAYQFTHALTRDVAYEAILFARRRDLHRRVALRIEEFPPQQIEEQLALLARHYLMAEEWERAFSYHLRAGRQAQERFANREAIALFERCIQINHELATRQAAPSDQQIIELYERLGGLHTLLGEYDTAETRYEEALYLVERTGAPAETLVRVHYGLARVDEKRARFEQAFEIVDQALQLDAGRPSAANVDCLLLGAGLLRRFGRYQQSLEWGERALSMAEALGSLRDQAQALKLQGGTYRNIGDMPRARELTEQALGLFQQVQDLDGLAYAHNDLANIYADLGQLTVARGHYEQGAALKQTIGDIYGQALIACNLGELLRSQGEIADAIAEYAQALAIFERIGSLYMTGVLHMNLGAAHLLRGDLISAEAHLRPSADMLARAGAEDFLPELERYLAELELARGNLAEAYTLCSKALETALRLEARAEEGATRRLMSEILAQQGDLALAWQELNYSLALLREASGPHEVAKALVARAILARRVGILSEGRASLAEAIPILAEIGAQADLAEAHKVAADYEL
jgi:predicted ATPase/class 3 adenylate cyclase